MSWVWIMGMALSCPWIGRGLWAACPVLPRLVSVVRSAHGILTATIIFAEQRPLCGCMLFAPPPPLRPKHPKTTCPWALPSKLPEFLVSKPFLSFLSARPGLWRPCNWGCRARWLCPIVSPWEWGGWKGPGQAQHCQATLCCWLQIPRVIGFP